MPSTDTLVDACRPVYFATDEQQQYVHIAVYEYRGNTLER